MTLQLDLPLPVAFRRLGLEGAECSTGFAVKRAGRSELHYVEGDHLLVIEHVVPVGSGPATVLVIRKDAIRGWRPPFDDERISAAERGEIVRRVGAALEFLGERCEFV